ncbi:MAG TPA: cytochrome c [Chakrabartia sp.]|jgi:cytochrome c556|nr:cytochrome c [Chakrabartia sp.]
MKSRWMILGVATASMAAAAFAATPADVITGRQARYKDIAKASKAIQDELKKDAPNMAAIRANANSIATLAPKVVRWYPKGTGPEAGVKTEASPAIWSNWPGFKTKAVDFTKAAAGLKAAAAKGDAAQIKAAAGAMGGTCKGCHQDFRVKA